MNLFKNSYNTEKKQKGDSTQENITYKIYRTIAYQLFWERSSYYKKILFFYLIFTTCLVFYFFPYNQNYKTEFMQNNSTIFDIDFLKQGGDIKTIFTKASIKTYIPKKHLIQSEDTYEILKTKYGVSEISLKDSNRNILEYYSDFLPIGKEILIPEVEGIVYLAEKDGDINQILGRVSGGNFFDAVELNNLVAPDYIVKKDTYIILANAKLPAPPPPYYYQVPAMATYLVESDEIINGGNINSLLNNINFVDPLSHPLCSNYVYQRGVSSWHNGVDLSLFGGCPIRSVADGVVIFAGWRNSGEGYAVTIDHGSGVVSTYWHGNGSIWVSVGQKVSKAQEIMQMGCTGICTGTHLHFGLRLDGNYIDPENYIPYRR